MRTNNSRGKNIIISVYFIPIVLAILLATVFSAFSHLTKNPTLTLFIIVFAFIALFFLVHHVSKYFEYDSDGVKVVVINRGLLLADYLNYREHKLEFSKANLVGYKFHNYVVYRSMTLYIMNREGHKKKVTFNVTLVNKKKRRYIRQSLSKMIKLNRIQE